MIVCQVCNKNPATVHLTEISGNEKKEIHLCEECARKKGIGIKAAYSIPEVLGSIIAGPLAKELKRLAKISCPACGHTYADFRATGRLGCPHDYVAFRKAMIRVLEKIHGASRHVGKVPSTAGENVVKMREVLSLREKLRQAVRRENYEEAARLRDRLQQLEGTPGGNA